MGFILSFEQTSKEVNISWINFKGGNFNQHNLQKGILVLSDMYFDDANTISNYG